jgi:hypothetical protein
VATLTGKTHQITAEFVDPGAQEIYVSQPYPSALLRVDRVF